LALKGRNIPTNDIVIKPIMAAKRNGPREEKSICRISNVLNPYWS
jgi:hypothetical protein